MGQAHGLDFIHRYFPELSSVQLEQLVKLERTYTEWNARINVISRKDLGELYLRHVLHSLAIAKFIQFEPGSRVFDLGSGGGFPGIPLAILFPQTEFLLCDSIAKKIKVVSAVIDELQLQNARAVASRSENQKGQFDYIVSRAVAEFPIIHAMTFHLLKKKNRNGVPGGWICLKGGEIREEFQDFPLAQVIPLTRWFDEPFFETKKLVFVPY